MADTTKYTLRVSVEITSQGGYYSGGRLGVQENIELGTLGFIELAQVLGRFHELAQTIEKEREREVRHE